MKPTSICECAVKSEKLCQKYVKLEIRSTFAYIHTYISGGGHEKPQTTASETIQHLSQLWTLHKDWILQVYKLTTHFTSGGKQKD